MSENKTLGEDIYNAYMIDKKNVCEIAKEKNTTRQWISWNIRRYIDNNHIKFTVTTKDVCKICGNVCGTTRAVESNYRIRNYLNEVVIKKVVCSQCVDAGMVKCGKCKKPVKAEEAIRRKTKEQYSSYICNKCNTENFMNWYNNNKEHVADYRKKRLEKFKEKLENNAKQM